MNIFGGIEAGGTKFVCMVANNAENIIKEERFATTTPSETIGRVIEFFSPYKKKNELKAVGIGSFGPVDLDKDSPTFGFITSTPKPGWSDIDLRGAIQRELEVPVVFDTDVNVAAYGEHYWIKENHSFDPFIYVTIGTGIGVGVFINGSLLHGLVHTEAGHIAIPHDRSKDPFPGVCPYHGDCWEGLATGISMQKRWQISPENIPTGHIAWELESDYTAVALVNLIYVYSPRRIVLGGGISQYPLFHEIVRKKVIAANRGYLRSPMIFDNIEKFIVPPALGNKSGCLGAIAMAINTISKNPDKKTSLTEL